MKHDAGRHVALDIAGRISDERAAWERGFALVRDGEGKPVLSAAALPDGAAISVVFHDGARAAVLGEVGAVPPAPAPAEKPPKALKPAPNKAVQGSLF